jgi:hypothetical protein
MLAIAKGKDEERREKQHKSERQDEKENGNEPASKQVE